MREPHIFLLNGPPSAGKDTAATYLNDQLYTNFETQIVKFATPLKKGAAAIYLGGDDEEFAKHDLPWEKNIAKDIFLGKSAREVQIALSEIYMKKFHDDPQVFGKILAETIRREFAKGTSVFFVSDSGFRPEAEALVEAFTCHRVNLIRIHRPGYTFDGDSRSYIELKDLNVREADIYNEGTTMDQFFLDLKKFVTDTLGANV